MPQLPGKLKFKAIEYIIVNKNHVYNMLIVLTFCWVFHVLF